jgi:DNA-binding GntR family transcriptional regulator
MKNADKGSRSSLRTHRPSRQILTDGAYETVKELIMDNQLEPGERINIEELARQLEISTTPVREALARLESDGLVRKRALTGYAAAPLLNLASLGHLFEIRRLLEPHAAAKAAKLATDTEIANLREMVALMRADDIGDDYSHYRTFAAHDTEFHALVARYSGNPVLEQTLAGLHFHWHLYRLRFEPEVGVDTIAEHANIATAIADRDPTAAGEAMRAHLQTSEERLLPVAQREAPPTED